MHRANLQHQAEAAPQPRGCVCYVIDEGYLFPTLVSALQARAHVPPAVADVVIACIGEPTAHSEAVAAVAAARGVHFIRASHADIDGLHVMFGRFFLSEILPAHYRRVVYIDGDTQVRGALEPLFRADVPAGGFLACRDPAILFAQHDLAHRRRLAAYRQQIGLTGAAEDYFNSGVLVIDRAGWGAIAETCLGVYRERGEAFRFPDQDALNLGARDACTLISNRWNFPGFLIGSRAEAVALPRIYHFMSNPRPWNVAAQPWGEAWGAPYRGLLADHPELSFLKPSKSRMHVVRYCVQQFVKMSLSYRAVGRMREAPPQLYV
ncbi:glycosyltransferase family 8 protein [Phenylobacterium sp.]|jgi:lipopolysaccharide biosynthesis glycosyltransferase|uniref:glycosyltransferase family 8 protein n=1 Tax=Phenylobacterium sp. TaxID=1871053 RepID=UPI002F426765